MCVNSRLPFFKQVDALIFQRGIIVEDLAKRADMTPDQLKETLRSEHDVAISTLNSLAAALDSEWVLVPREHLTAVRRLLDGSGAVPDFAALSAAELYLATRLGARDSEAVNEAASDNAPVHRQKNQNDKKAKLDSETDPHADLVKSGALISEESLRKQLGISATRMEALVSDGSIFALDVDSRKVYPAILCNSALCLDRLWKIAKVIVPAPPAMRLDFLTQACAALEDRAPVDLLDDDRDYKQLRAYAKGWASEFSRTAVVVWDADTREELSLAKPIYTCSAALDPRRPLWRRALIAIRAPGYTQPVEAPPALASMVIVVERAVAGQEGTVPEAGFVCHLRGRILATTVHASDGAEISHEMKLTTKQPTVVDVADALFTLLGKVNRRADLATSKVRTKKGPVAGLKKTSSRRRHKG
ncbi:hypothetical protein [Caballeronia sordidicola]|uniref:hypothetical protein n=1 Tax=Caballeronia sordidicola TaxID=196367 RepID=UPI000763F92F|nr:hypothetical protein [Caballeronia sordidicola]